jgi:hypothetical protein
MSIAEYNQSSTKRHEPERQENKRDRSLNLSSVKKIMQTEPVKCQKECKLNLLTPLSSGSITVTEHGAMQEDILVSSRR